MKRFFGKAEVIVDHRAVAFRFYAYFPVVLWETHLIKRRVIFQNALREGEYFLYFKGCFRAGAKRLYHTGVFAAVDFDRFVEKLFHNVTLTVGPAVIVVCSPNASAMADAGVRHRLNAVGVVLSGGFYIVFARVLFKLFAYFIHTVVEVRVVVTFPAQFILGNLDFYTAYRVDDFGHAEEIDRCVIFDIKTENVVERAYRGNAVVGIGGVNFAVTLFTVLVGYRNKGIPHYRNYLYGFRLCVDTQYHYTVGKALENVLFARINAKKGDVYNALVYGRYGAEFIFVKVVVII